MGKIEFKAEATEWSEALPIGNGRLGAMVYGGVDKDHVQINEDTVWYGGSMNRINPDAKQNLEKVRQLIVQERIQEAEELLRYAFTGTPQGMRMYQSGGDFFLRMQDTASPVTNYHRELSMDEAVVRVSYCQNEVHYKREYFVSAQTQTIVIAVSADKQGAVNVDGIITRDKMYDSVESMNDNSVMLKGSLGKGGLDFALGCSVVAEGGIVVRMGENLVVRNADRAIFYLTEETTFRDFWKDFQESGYLCELTPEQKVERAVVEQQWQKRLEIRIQNVLQDAQKLPYDEVLKNHIAEHRSYFDRVLLQLDEEDEEQLLMKNYFDFGRYLMICGSRPGSMPLNLQGIWNDRMQPPWDSKYTVNINTEMNYWPAESCDLPEFHEPLFVLLRRAMERGRKTAREMYGCRGFVIHHNTDIWGDTAPQDIWLPGTYWVLGGAWLSTHIWKHFEYTQDVAWLRENYDILEEAVLFMEDFVMKQDDTYVISPSVSPENTYIMGDGTMGRVCQNATMDVMILRELLEDYLMASDLLANRNEITQKAEEILRALPAIQIGRYGQIMEWEKDYKEKDPGHRHISHLYALWPGRDIMPDKTPELARAAEVTLERRLSNGGGYTGWSCAWLICFYARLWDGENAYNMLKKILRESTFPNLMDSHPGKKGSVFQIDGNMGSCAAIVEMLIQSEADRVVLLPACPSKWKDGKLCGVKVKGNAKVDIEWKNGELVSCRIYAVSEWEKELLYQGKSKKVSLKQGEEIVLSFSHASFE